MKIIWCILILIPLVGFSQPDSVSLPFKGRIVFYEAAYPLNHGTKSSNFSRAKEWLQKTFPEPNNKLAVADKASGRLVGQAVFRVVTDDTPDPGQTEAYYWVRCSLAVTVSDSRIMIEAYDFYEKPMYKGVTNDYSKIEYRWRDFTKGKPWKPGDRKLFAGLDHNARQTMEDLNNVMKK